VYAEHHNFSYVLDTLPPCQKAASEGRKGEDELVLAGQRFLVAPSGAKVGKKRARAYFQWQLASEIGFSIQLMKRETCTASSPNCKVEAPSLVLMRFGIKAVVDAAFAAIEALGAKIQRNKVSRVDVCADLPGVDISPLYEAFAANHVVSRAVERDTHVADIHLVDTDASVYWMRKQVTSFNAGGGDVRMRVYDKIKETGSDHKKLETLVNRRWGVFPFKAIRVEFQLRRGKLRQLGVDDLDDWFAKRATIVRYLTQDWFRLTDGPVLDRKHPDRTPLLPHWIDVQRCFAAWTGDGPSLELRPVESKPMPADHYTRSFVGMLVSLFAKTGTDIDSNDTFMHEAIHRLLDEIELRNMPTEVLRRRLELGLGTLPKVVEAEGTP
jgi:hypothetical protein